MYLLKNVRIEKIDVFDFYHDFISLCIFSYQLLIINYNVY